MKIRKPKKGFTMVELLVAMTIMLIVLAAAAAVLQKGSDATTIALDRAEMQLNARVAINTITRDLTQAGAAGVVGFPFGGISLPDKAPVYFARDAASNNYCNNNTFSTGVLTAVTPGFNDGPTIDGITTDCITIVYLDQSVLNAPCSNWATTPLQSVTPSGSQTVVQVSLCPPLNDPVYGFNVGDIVIVSNSNGAALGQVTSLPSVDKVDFASSDPINVNQPSASHGNIASILAGNPPTYMSKIYVVTYFIQQLDANNNPIPIAGVGTVAPNAVDYRLMKMQAGGAPVPVAEHIVNLKFSYDLMSATGVETSADASAAIPDGPVPPGVPAYTSIRNVYVSVTARSPRPMSKPLSGNNDGYTYSTMYTAISPRNLSFKNRYQ
jgi:prepilin-type N-terminal cleavage/methylation domain-containing protein